MQLSWAGLGGSRIARLSNAPLGGPVRIRHAFDQPKLPVVMSFWLRDNKGRTPSILQLAHSTAKALKGQDKPAGIGSLAGTQ